MVRVYECDICGKKCTRKSGLKRHKADIHNIDVIWYPCDLCDYKCKRKGQLKTHKADVHDINVKWYHCDLCDYKCKRYRTVIRHKALIHDIGVKWYPCDLCDRKFKQKANLKQHKADIHDIGVKWYQCDICDFKSKQNSGLKTHKADVHDIDVKWYPCDICDYKCKQKGSLKRHKKTHDTEYQARQKCKEHRLFEYLYKHFDVKREHVIDFQCFSDDGKRCRIDFVIRIRDKIFLVECDEFQHIHYPVLCENRRTSDIMSGLLLDGNTLPVCMVRFNPDSYKINNKRQSCPTKQRYEQLKTFIETYEPTIPFAIKYMFYDTINNEVCLTRNEDFAQELVQFII